MIGRAFLCGTTYDQMGWNVDLEVDWVFLRKYVYPEPAHGSWGVEEHSDPSGRISLLWTIINGKTQDEIEAQDDVLEDVEGYFWDTGDYVAKSFSAERESFFNFVDYGDKSFDFATAFYKGDSFWDPPEGIGYDAQYYIEGEGGENEKIWDYEIAVNTTNGVTDFVFLWTCGMALEQGELGPPIRGMSPSWLQTDDLSENGYEDPDNTEHCYMSFVYYSPFFTESTGYEEHTYGDFVKKFYERATDGDHSIKEALDYAAQDILGADYYLSETDLYNGYWFVITEGKMQGSYWCYIRVLGDGNTMLTT